MTNTLKISWNSCVQAKSNVMLYSEIFAVFPEIHTKHINTLCGQNVELVNVWPGGTYNNQWTLSYYVKTAGHHTQQCALTV